MASDILIVDDEADIRDLVAGILDDEGFSTRTARDSDSALAEIANRRPPLPTNQPLRRSLRRLKQRRTPEKPMGRQKRLTMKQKSKPQQATDERGATHGK